MSGFSAFWRPLNFAFIFRRDYFDRIMMLNSTVWTCALTSRPQLTYAEALESERDARRVLRNFPYELKAPLLYIAGCTQRSGILEMVDDCISFMSTRFFREEHVSVQEKISGREKDVWRDCEVLAVLSPDGVTGDPLAEADGVDAALVRYKVRRLPDEKTKKLPEPFVANGSHLRRPRGILSKDKVKLFLKQCVECNEDGMLKVKAALYEKHVIDGGVNDFSDFWVGKAPTFATSKYLQSKQRQSKEKTTTLPSSHKKKSTTAALNGSTSGGGGDKEKTKANAKDKVKPSSKENKKPAAKSKDKNATAAAANHQPAISKYFSKNGTAVATSRVAAVKENKEELLRQRKAKEEAEAAAKRQQIEERDRQRVELNQRIAVALKTYNRIADDLELADQRPLPVAKPVRTLIPNALLGNAFFVLEFMCSFQSVLECTDKFPRGYNLALLERSLLCREVAGPLSDTIQVLLGTVFSLQIEESRDVFVSYVDREYFEANAQTNYHSFTPDVDRAVRDASLATGWTQQFLSTSLAQLPMDSNTVSELLRLHLLTSGALEDEECGKWRYQQRGGYRNVDDPGLALRVYKPHIVHALATKTVYQLPIADVLQILMCLVNQIISYSTIRDLIDERRETAQRARINLRTLVAAERKREAALQTELRTLRETYRKRVKDDPPTTSNLERELNEKIRIINGRAERAKSEFQHVAQSHRQEIFSYQLQLGTDRAHRTYWLFESVHGLFVERPSRLGACMAEPVQHDAVLAQYTNDVERNKYIKQLVTEEDKSSQKNRSGNGNIDKFAQIKPDVAAAVSNDVPAAAAAEAVPALSTELLMCTGSAATCPVHRPARADDGSENNDDDDADDDDWVYSFLHTEQELNALIAGLNTRGQRERALKEQLETDRELILNHIASCDVQRLQVPKEKRSAALDALYALPNYAKANMGFPSTMAIADVSEGTLVDGIADLERRITEGHLGTMRVPDLSIWRQALTDAKDDGQSADLRWGPDAAFSKGECV